MSTGDMSSMASMDSATYTQLPWVRTTPFGSPVVPDVYINRPMLSAFGRRKSALLIGVIPVSSQRGPWSISMLTICGMVFGASGIAANPSSTIDLQSSAQRMISVLECDKTKPRVLTPATKFNGVAR